MDTGSIKTPNTLYWITLFTIIIGLILSFISALKLCSTACAETGLYRFYGFKFDFLGIAFFAAAFLFYTLSTIFPSLLFVVGLMASAAIGAEVIFILVQYLEMDEWCPICLSIAFTCGLLALLLLINTTYRIKKLKRVQVGRMALKGISNLSAFALGLVVALFGVGVPEHSFADGTSEKEDPVFGNRKSPIEIYVISDWYCPACKEIEPTLEKTLPNVMNQASVLFIDRMIHPESLNYLPYNLSFMLKEKPKYLKLRKALAELTHKTKNPTMQDVQEAVQPLEVTYKPLNFSDIESGMRFFQGISETFQVNSTPTVVIANKKKVKAKKLIGTEEITQQNIELWIKKLS